MAITNGYATLAELKRELAVESLQILDDEVLNDIITDASRALDNYCARQFYAASASRSYDVPDAGDPELWLDEDWLTVTAITNGDGASIAASLCDLWPMNAVSKCALRLKNSSGLSWTASSGGDYQGVITISGSTGYVDRAASDAKSATIIRNTHRACLLTASAYYRARFGQEQASATITGAGVVLTPQGLPRGAVQLIEGYRRMP